MKFPALVQNETIKIHTKKQSVLFIYFCSIFIIGIGIANRLSPDLRAGIDYLEFARTMLSFLSVFLILFAIVLGAQSVTDEYRDGTIKQLFLRPVSRASILLSKYTANLFVLVFAILILYVVSAATDIVLFGTGRSGSLTLWTVFRLYLYALPDAFFMMTVSFFIATVFKSSPLAITASLIFNIGGEAMSTLIPESWGARYIVFNHLDLRMYDKNPLVNEGAVPPFLGMSFGFSLAVIFAHIIILLLICIVVFEKRDVY
jgi:ABC-2 type transport system permease protein